MGDYYKNITEDPKIPELAIPALGEIELNIPAAPWKKILNYARAAQDLEISGFADLTYDKETGLITVGEVYLLEQTVGGATVHMDEDTVAQFNLEMAKKGVTQLPQLWWHSHVDMGAFFSGTDQDTSEGLRNDSFSASLVVNKRGDHSARIYIKASTTVNAMGENFVHNSWISIDNLTVRIETLDEIPQEIKDEVEEKIHQKKYKLPVFDKTKTYGKNWFGGKKKDEEDEEEDDDDTDITKFDSTSERTTEEKHKRKGDKEEQSQDEWEEEMHDGYSLDPKVHIIRLPKDPIEAKRKADNLNLGKRWNTLAHEYVYSQLRVEDPKIIYVDWYEVLNWEDYEYAYVWKQGDYEKNYLDEGE